MDTIKDRQLLETLNDSGRRPGVSAATGRIAVGYAFRSALAATWSLRRMLAIGCHADDIEIGCGGTILSLTRAWPRAEVDWVVLAARESGPTRLGLSAEAFLAGAADCRVEMHGFRDGYLPYEGGAVKEVFESLKPRGDPDLVLTHTRDDLHQDHRLACELTWNTFRDHLVLEYEMPKGDGDLGRPERVRADHAGARGKKLDLLEAHFPTQRVKHWYDEHVSAH